MVCPLVLVNGHLPALLSSVFASIFLSPIVLCDFLPVVLPSVVSKRGAKRSAAARACGGGFHHYNAPLFGSGLIVLTDHDDKIY
jgi:hypothetical protein